MSATGSPASSVASAGATRMLASESASRSSISVRRSRGLSGTAIAPAESVAVERADVVEPVRQHDRHAVAGPDAPRAQEPRPAVASPRRARGRRCASSPDEQRRARRMLLRGVAQQPGEALHDVSSAWRSYVCSPGPDPLLVEELGQPLLAPALGVEELRLLELGVEVVLGLIPAHRAAVLEAELGRAQHDRVLRQQLARERLDLGAQVGQRHARVDEAHLGRLTAAERAPGHDVEQRRARADACRPAPC